MKRTLLFLLLLLSLTSFGQLKFLPKDTITHFSLTFIQSGGGRDNYYSIEINSKGRIKVIFKDMSDEIAGRKDIQLDANTFRQFKNSIITNAKLYELKDTFSHRRVYDAPSDILTVKSNLGTKILYGCGREQFDEDYEFLIDELYDLVGRTIGNFSDLK